MRDENGGKSPIKFGIFSKIFSRLKFLFIGSPLKSGRICRTPSAQQTGSQKWL